MLLVRLPWRFLWEETSFLKIGKRRKDDQKKGNDYFDRMSVHSSISGSSSAG
jgi:hypothetical protein